MNMKLSIIYMCKTIQTFLLVLIIVAFLTKDQNSGTFCRIFLASSQSFPSLLIHEYIVDKMSLGKVGSAVFLSGLARSQEIH